MTKSAPLVSVVVPTYDRPSVLREAIDSVAEQTYDRVELVVVDDCSPTPVEESLDVDAWPALDVTVLRHDENRGGSAARNTGIANAEGELIAFLDDDDCWNRRKLERQVAVIERASPGVGVVYTGHRKTDAGGDVLRVKRPTADGDLTRQLLCRNVVGTFSSVMVHREAIETSGTLDERFPSWQDWEWYVRLSRDHRFASIPDPLVTHRDTGGAQISDDLDSTERVSYPLFIEKYEPLAATYGRPFRRKMRGWVACNLAWTAIRSEEYGRARTYMARAVAWYPLEPTFYLFLLLLLGGSRVYGFAREVAKIRG